ncbi:conserved hypothetical protein [Pediculus humanus corporis]|uniref:Uncharacterized protein n=1 Tax=Pediculus humanus subsp. corporis TaxID=121224 RepID=E0VB30_PEDHC|nr:uncharacterized protein Phum_PHUM050840 [Pediculus humanus corporis]EEB10586.1 conserved hypothetical protein [Pediculus humanus corporis]
MWFKIDGENYIGKKIVNGESCTILISDFKNVWHRALHDYDLFSTFQELIFNLFIEDDKVKKYLLKDNNNDNIVLKLESIQIGVKFYFEIFLFKGNEELLYNEFTLPLLQVVIEMENREKKLLEIIEEKTLELEECKQEKKSSVNESIKPKTSCVKVSHQINRTLLKEH